MRQTLVFARTSVPGYHMATLMLTLVSLESSVRSTVSEPDIGVEVRLDEYETLDCTKKVSAMGT